jgi:hypothetical protein
MVARNLRGEIVPANLILMTAGAVPSGYTNTCALYGKYIVGIPTACTNPGCCTGSTTHTHAAGGSHCHGGPFSAPHGHSGSSGAGGCSLHPIGIPGGGGVSHQSHTHAITGNPAITTITQGPGTAHCHGSGPSEAGLKRTTIRYISKSSSVINMRSKQIGEGVVGLWDSCLSLIPPDYNDCSAFYDRYVKAIPCASASTLSNTCSASHCHPCAGSCHTHPLSMSSHTHPVSQAAGAPSIAWNPGPFPETIVQGHTHPQPALSPAINPFFSSSGNLHSHSSTVELKRYSISHIKRNTIHNIRRTGLPNCFTGIWLCPLACIPSGWSLNCNTIDRYPKGILNACTCPGASIGSNCHGHGPEAPHGHSFCVSHTHTGTPLGTASGGAILKTTGPHTGVSTSHGHSFAGLTGPVSGSLTPGGIHSHGCQSHKPASIEVAFIKRV